MFVSKQLELLRKENEALKEELASKNNELTLVNIELACSQQILQQYRNELRCKNSIINKITELVQPSASSNLGANQPSKIINQQKK